jgi:hypothetical protein
LVTSSSHIGMVSSVTVDMRCSGTFMVGVDLGKGQVELSLYNQSGPLHHNWWFWSWWGSEPLEMGSAGFSAEDTCLQSLVLVSSWISDTLLATKVFHAVVGDVIQCSTIVEFVQ